MASIVRDFRFGLKLLLRNRAFSLAVLLTLGVCIGANVAIYGVIDAVVLSSLPFEQPDRLVKMYNLYPGLGVGREQAANGSADFFLRRKRVEGLEEVAAYQAGGSAVGQPESTPNVPSASSSAPQGRIPRGAA